jgi:phenylalanyl-tRNA synthetase beta chain
LAGAEAPAGLAVWRELSSALGRGARIDQSRVPGGLHATRSATLQAGKEPMGAVGEVAPDVLAAFGVTERVAILEIDLDEFLVKEPKPTQWKPTSRYPSSDLDLSFLLDESVPAERLEKAIRSGSGKYLVDLELFDVYRSPDGGGARALGYRLRLQASDRSLTDADIAEVRRSIEANATKLGAELRS